MHIWHTLRHPPQINDPQQQYQANLLHIILWGSLILELVRSTIFLFIPGINHTMSLVATLATTLITASIFYLLYQKYIKLASFLFLVTIWLLLTIIIIFAGGSSSAIFLTYIELIIVAGFLFNGRTAFLSAILITLTGAILYLLQNQGIINPNDNINTNRLLSFATISHNFFITAILIWLNQNHFQQALLLSQQQEKALLANNNELKQIRQTMAQEIAERTRNAEEARRTAENARQLMSNQVWLAEGQATLNEHLRHQQNPQQLAINLITFICQYIGIEIGALYIFENDLLHFYAGYAYPLDSPPPIPLGSGIIGQVGQTHKPIALTELTPDNLTLISGLGQTHLPHLTTNPILYNQQLIGVITLGHQTPLSNYDYTFLKYSLDTIALAFRQTPANRKQQP
ncbi:MAG TPA: GAF domain-containing protein [Anaerolineae bacterium]|nr:GAF domain-containing protein [Anaerolineae bacterium]